MKIQNQIPINSYKPDGGFVAAYQKLVRDVVLPYQYAVLNDAAPDTEKSHVVKNFINAAHALKGEDIEDGFYGMVFQDSDAAKWLEAVAYSLSLYPDPELEAQADELIGYIAAAQDKDGYLNTYYTVKDREKRWTNLLEGHELYCAGHMMEAACAYYEATGKRTLLDVMAKNAEHIYDVFVTQEHGGYPGHPEVELALLKLARLTKNERFFELAKHFIDVRGVNPHFYEEERAKRDWVIWGSDPANHEYQQNDKSVREFKKATGHAVRAAYLYTGMADMASETDDAELNEACKALWDNITKKQMYITGAIGSTAHGEAFSVDYDLPNDTVYAETCASIALMMFASRMLEKEVDREYADVMELAFYNTVLAGMQADGRHFFYVNPLEVIPGMSGVVATRRHVIPQRPKWYGCACCPPNLARLLTSFGKYAYGESDTTAYCHLYAQGEVTFANGVALTCKTEYPYDFTVTYAIKKGGKLAIRIPARCKKAVVSVNGATIEPETLRGYVYFDTADGDTITLELNEQVRFIYPSAKIPALTGFTCVMRGPLVYCFEGVDNDGDVLSLRIDPKAEVTAEAFSDGLLKDTVKLTFDAYRVAEVDGLYTEEEPQITPCKAAAIPYYLWGNRGINQMRVWMARK